MNRLNEVLERMRNTLEEPPQPKPTQPLGSISDDGKLITASLDMNRPLVQSEASQQPQEMESQASPAKASESPLSFSHSPEEKAMLSLALGRICDLQKQYGKAPPNLKGIVDGFLWVLKDYRMDFILGAIAQYAKRNADIPAPADIVNLIDPEPEPLSAAVYVGIKKRMADGNVFIPQRERNYCNAFERQEMDKVRGGSIELRHAHQEIEHHRLAIGFYEG